LNELALFAGAGGGILGGQLLGWKTVCAVEIEPYCSSILAQRQNDGLLPPFPIWDDVCTFDGKPWRGIVDVISGGFPCQDISAAGKGEGITGERSGLWKEFKRIICEVQPRYAFIENSPMLTIRGLDTVLCDLAEIGFDAEWGVLGASSVGAPHKRERIWILANTGGRRLSEQKKRKMEQSRRAEIIGTSEAGSTMANTDSFRESQPEKLEQEFGRRAINSSKKLANTERPGLEGYTGNEPEGYEPGRQRKEPNGSAGEKGLLRADSEQWLTEPNVGRVVNGVDARMDRLKAIGNGQVPQCAAEAWRLLEERLTCSSTARKEG
jgi:DNA (cytosine-5)-methyltransferase 1